MTASRRVRITLTTLALAATLAAPVFAAPDGGGSANGAIDDAGGGRDLRDKNDLNGALQRFKAADDIMHVPTTSLEVARTQVSLGLLVEARDTIAGIHKTSGQPDDPTPFKEARVKADELDAQLEGRIPTLTISVNGGTEGDAAAITVDGVSLPSSAATLPRRIDPGHHVISAKAASGEAKEELDIGEGEKKEVTLTLIAGSGAPQEESAGADTGPIVHTPGPLTYGAIVVGGVGLATGAVTGILELSKASKVKGECPKEQCAQGTAASDLSSAKTLATISTVGFAVAAAGGIVAAVSLVLGHRGSGAAQAPASEPESNPGGAPNPDAASPPESRLRATPWIGPGSAGIFGTF